MKSKRSKILILALVTFLLVVGFNTVFVNALDISSRSDYSSSGALSVTASDEAVCISASDAPRLICPRIRIQKPTYGESFLEPAPLVNEYVNIYVVDNNGDPLDDAAVRIYEYLNYDEAVWRGFTDDGTTNWPKPNVDKDTKYKIEAEKFIDGKRFVTYTYVTIRNRTLSVSATPNPVVEGNEFFVTVVDQDNQPLPLVKVKFNGQTKYTDSDGEVSFKAPYIDDDAKTFGIKASAPARGYDSGSGQITVTNDGVPLPHTIYGQVRDYDFKPIKNAKITVTLADGSASTYTDKNGEYRIVVTPKEGGEQVTVTASYSGCKTQKVKVWINSEDTESTKVNFWLIGEDDPGNQNAPQGQQVVAQTQAQLQVQECLSYQSQQI